MPTLSISQAEKDKLNYERYNNPEVIVQKRLHAVYLKAHKNLSNKEIADCVGLSRNSVKTYIDIYVREGIKGLCKLNYVGPKSEIDNHKTTLVEYFENNPPHNTNHAITIIKDLTGIERKPTQVRKWMKNNGLKYLKTGQIPAKADHEEQKHFLENELEPLIEQAKKEEVHLLFMDSAHFVMGVFFNGLMVF